MRIYTHTNGAGLTSITSVLPLDIREIAENRDGTWSLWRPSEVGAWWDSWCVAPRMTEPFALAWIQGGEWRR